MIRPRPTEKRPMRRHVPLAIAALSLFSFSAACSSSDGAGDRSTTTPDSAGALATEPVAVSAAFYPLAEAAARVGGECVAVTNLTPPGGGPHDLELTPKQVEDLADTDLLVYLSKGFQPAIEDAAAGLPSSASTLDVLDGMDLLTVSDQLEGTQGEVDGEELEGGYDPHVWVNPVLQEQLATSIHDELTTIAPTCAATFDAGLADYVSELSGLDERYRDGLAACTTQTIVTSHRAFEYLAQEYGLVQVSIAGLSPDEEPDPRTLEAVAARAQADGVTTIFFESQVPPDLSETVANEIGASTDFLDPVETIGEADLADGTTYATIMDRNLESLTAALACP